MYFIFSVKLKWTVPKLSRTATIANFQVLCYFVTYENPPRFSGWKHIDTVDARHTWSKTYTVNIIVFGRINNSNCWFLIFIGNTSTTVLLCCTSYWYPPSYRAIQFLKNAVYFLNLVQTPKLGIHLRVF